MKNISAQPKSGAGADAEAGHEPFDSAEIGLLDELLGGRAGGLVMAVAILFTVLVWRSQTFLSVYTMSVISEQMAFFVLIALSQAVCLVIGGMNLSVGAIGGLCTVVLGLCMGNAGWSGWVSVPIVLAVGCAAGWLNGLLVARLRINSFIVTLSMMFVYMGLRSGISGGSPYQLPESFMWAHRMKLLGMPGVFLIMLIVLAVTSYMFRDTVFGRQLLATGGNADAARLSGINTDAMIVAANVLSGGLAALAAVLWASQLGSAAPETGDNWLIISFAVAIIGGTGLSGGIFSGFGIFMGAAVFMLIKHGLVELKANDYYANSFLGGLILLAVALDRVRELYGRK